MNGFTTTTFRYLKRFFLFCFIEPTFIFSTSFEAKIQILWHILIVLRWQFFLSLVLHYNLLIDFSSLISPCRKFSELFYEFLFCSVYCPHQKELILYFHMQIRFVWGDLTERKYRNTKSIMKFNKLIKYFCTE